MIGRCKYMPMFFILQTGEDKKALIYANVFHSKPLKIKSENTSRFTFNHRETQLRGQFVIPTGLYSDRSIFRQVYIPTGLYSDRSIFRQVDIPTGRYSDILTGRYSHRSLFRHIYIPTDLYSCRSIFRHVVIPTVP